MIKPSEVTIIIPHLGADEQQEYSMDQCLISLRETAPEIKRIVAINGSKCPERFDQEEEVPSPPLETYQLGTFSPIIIGINSKIVSSTTTCLKGKLCAQRKHIIKLKVGHSNCTQGDGNSISPL